MSRSIAEKLRMAQNLPGTDNNETQTFEKKTYKPSYKTEDVLIKNEARMLSDHELDAQEKIKELEKALAEKNREVSRLKSNPHSNLSAKDLIGTTVRLFPETNEIVDLLVEKTARYAKDNDIKLHHYEKVSKGRLMRYLVESFCARVDQLDHKKLATSNDLYASIESLFKEVE